MLFLTISKASKRTFRFQRNKDASKKTRVSRLRVHETYMRLWTVRLRIPLQRARSWLWPQASELERDVGARSVTRGTYNYVQTNWYIHRRLRRSERVFPRAYAPAARERRSERSVELRRPRSVSRELGRAPLVARDDWSTTLCLYLLR